MKSKYRCGPGVIFLLCMFSLFIAGPVTAQTPKAASSYDFPQTIDTSAKHLFYIPNIVVNLIGPQGKHPRHPEWGTHDFYGILEAFKKEGFIVISGEKAKGKGKPPGKITAKEIAQQVYTLLPDSQEIAQQVEKLLASGLPPENITVSGFSRGGTMSLVVSTLVKNPRINYVILAGCCGNHPNPAISSHAKDSILPLMSGLQGRFLSIQDIGDDQCQTCEKEFEMAVPEVIDAREIKINTGLGHGAFWTIREEWFDVMISWLNRSLP